MGRPRARARGYRLREPALRRRAGRGHRVPVRVRLLGADPVRIDGRPHARDRETIAQAGALRTQIARPDPACGRAGRSGLCRDLRRRGRARPVSPRRGGAGADAERLGLVAGGRLRFQLRRRRRARARHRGAALPGPRLLPARAVRRRRLDRPHGPRLRGRARAASIRGSPCTRSSTASPWPRLSPSRDAGILGPCSAGPSSSWRSCSPRRRGRVVQR